AFARIDEPPVIKGDRVAGVQSNGLGEIGNCLVVVAFFPKSGAPVCKGENALRIESNGLAQGRDSLVIVTVVGICVALAQQGRVARSRLCFSLFALFLPPESGEPLLLGFLGLALCFSIGCGFGLALLARLRGSEPLLLRRVEWRQAPHLTRLTCDAYVCASALRALS